MVQLRKPVSSFRQNFRRVRTLSMKSVCCGAGSGSDFKSAGTSIFTPFESSMPKNCFFATSSFVQPPLITLPSSLPTGHTVPPFEPRSSGWSLSDSSPSRITSVPSS